MKLAVFALFLCSSAECSSPDEAAPRRRRQQSQHRHEQNFLYPAATASLCRGSNLCTTIKSLRKKKRAAPRISA
jgi:hypothetical protein